MQICRIGGFRFWGQRAPSTTKPAVVTIELQQASGHLQAMTLTEAGLDCTQVCCSNPQSNPQSMIKVHDVRYTLLFMANKLLRITLNKLQWSQLHLNTIPRAVAMCLMLQTCYTADHCNRDRSLSTAALVASCSQQHARAVTAQGSSANIVQPFSCCCQ